MPDGKPIRKLGRYALYDAIASGGMAKVHLGQLLGPVGFSRTVAIKRLHPHLAAEQEFVNMFLDEARLAARIRHPNVVPTLDVIAEDGELLLVMEYVQGESLGKLLGALTRRGERIAPRIASAILCDALNGLHAAHETRDEKGQPLHIVHRDVSPQNIVVGTDGMSRVVDFGIAKAVRRLQTTRTGQVRGKVAYMAPEQLTDGTSDRAVDVYAASVVLWEALTGRRLFAADTDGALVRRVLDGPVEPPSAGMVSGDTGPLTLRVYREVDAVVLRGLAKRPEERFPTAKAMAEALEQCLPPSPRAAVGEWVERVAEDVLAERARLVAAIEADAPADETPSAIMHAIKSSPAESPEAPGSLGEEDLKSATAPRSGSAKSKSGDAKTTRTRVALAVGAVLSWIVAFVVVRVSFSRDPPTAAPSASSAASAAPLAVAVTDMPHATSANPEAQAAYEAGLQAIRDGATDTAMQSFARATSLDHSFAAAYLRLAICESPFGGQEAETRHALGLATQLRHVLSERDQALLDGFEPYFQRDQPDLKESERRLAKAAELFPRDAETSFYLGLVRSNWGQMQGALTAFAHATTLDPKFALALAYEGGAHAYLGDFDAARETLDRCLGLSPSGTDCLWFRIEIDAQQGKCSETEADAKAWIARDQEDFYGYQMLAQALVAENRPLDAVRAVLGQRWAKTAPASRAARQLLDKSRLEILTGDFVTAEADLRELERTTSNEPMASTHARPARMLVQIYDETERADAALAEASDYMKRGAAWSTPPLVSDGTISEDPVPLMLATLARGGAMRPADLEAKQREWVDLWRGKTSGVYVNYLWIYGYALPAESPKEAAGAIAALDAFLPLPPFASRPTAHGFIGKVYLRAGRPQEALPFLRTGAGSCGALSDPIGHTRSLLDLGLALEAEGDKDAACQAYRSVVARWGAAKPRSVTSDKARRRELALRCRP
jgi:tetratricopeptide (TPR) repeat protein